MIQYVTKTKEEVRKGKRLYYWAVKNTQSGLHNLRRPLDNKTQCMFWFLDITILWIYFLPAELHFSKFQTPLKWRQNRIWKRLLLWAIRSPLEGSDSSVADITCCDVKHRALFLHGLPVEFIWFSEYRWLPQTRVTNWSFSWRSDTFSGRQKSNVKRFI